MRSPALILMLVLLAAFPLHRGLAQTEPNPTVLPTASRQIPNWDWYTSLSMLSAPANTPYTDPATGVVVRKITSPADPVTNGSMRVDYAEGGPYISREWGTQQHTILVRAPNGISFLADYRRGVGASNWRDLFAMLPHRPSSPLTSSFSNLASTARIMFFVQDDKLYRLNTATMALEQDDTGHMNGGIKSIAQAAGGRLDWMQVDKDDKWFVFQACFPQPGDNSGICLVEKVIAYNRETNIELWRSCLPTDDTTHKIFNCFDTHTNGQSPDSPLDGIWDSSDQNEPHLDRDGRYVVLMDGTQDADPTDQFNTGARNCGNGSLGRKFDEYYWHRWDLTTDTTVCKQNVYTGHPAWVRGSFVSADPTPTDYPDFYYTPGVDPAADLVTNTAAYQSPINDPTHYAFITSHQAGQWIQSVADATQWYWGSNYSDGEVTILAWEANGSRNPSPAPPPPQLPQCPSLPLGELNEIFHTVFVQANWPDCDPGNGVDREEICWTPQYRKPDIGIRAVYQASDDLSQLSRNLTQVNSVCDMTPGTFYFALPHSLYIWAFNGGNPGIPPSQRLFFFAPTPVHRGVGVRRVNGMDARLLCHNYTWPGEFVDGTKNPYWETPFATTSPDGKLVMFESNMGKRAGSERRTDVFVAEVPLTSGGGGGGGGPCCRSGPDDGTIPP